VTSQYSCIVLGRLQQPGRWLGKLIEHLRVHNTPLDARQRTRNQFQPHKGFINSNRILQPSDEGVREAETRIVARMANQNDGAIVSASARLDSCLIRIEPIPLR
jgi:hypothetical protein